MLKIATYNLRNLYAEGVRMSYGKEIPITKQFVDAMVADITKNIAKMEPDILLAQEVASKEVFERIANATNLPYRAFVATPDSRGIGNAALLKVEATAGEALDVKDFPVMVIGETDAIGRSIASARPFVHVETLYNKKPLHIFGLHLKSGSAAPIRESKGGTRIPAKNQSEASDDIIRSGVFRLAQARRLRQLVDELFAKDSDAQIILLGDFNSVKHSDVMKAIEGIRVYPQSQLVDVAMTVAEEKRFTYISQGVHILIDHVLISKSLLPHVESVEILNEELLDQSELPELNFTASDHAPILLTLK